MEDIAATVEEIRRLVAAILTLVGLSAGVQLWRVIVQAKNERDFS